MGSDLHQGARDATGAMIEQLVTTAHLDPSDTYALLCSVVGHLRIVEVVDAPTWVVAMELDQPLLA